MRTPRFLTTWCFGCVTSALFGSALLSTTVHARASSAANQDAAETSYSYLSGLAEKGLHDLVVRAANDFLKDHPRHARTRHVQYRLGVALVELGRAREALDALSEPASERAFEFAAEANLRLARAAASTGDAARAEAAATRALEWGRDYLRPLALATRAEARAARGEWQLARADHEAVLACRPEPEAELDARMGAAWCAWRGGDPRRGADEARALCARADLPAARADVARVLLGECELDAGRAAEALDAFRSVRGETSAEAAARGAGHALVALKRQREAAEEFERALALARDPRAAAECVLRAGMALVDAGDVRGARAILSDARAAGDAPTSYWRARAELADGDAVAALSTADAALARGAEGEWSAHLATARGAALEKLGRAEEAAAAYARAGSTAGLLSLASAHLTAGRFSEARDAARKLLTGTPAPTDPGPAWSIVGEACLRLGQHGDGAQAFLEAARAESDPARVARARLRAAWCRHLSGDARGARELFDAAAHGPLDPDEREEASFFRARSAEASGERAEAARLYREHVETFPNGSHALEALVRFARTEPDERAFPVLARLCDAGTRGDWIDLAAFDLAERLTAAGRHEEAGRRYGEVVARAHDARLVERARYGGAWSAYARGDHAAAQRALEEWFATPPPSSTAAGQPGEALARPSADLRAAGLELAVCVAVGAGDAARACAAWARWSSAVPRGASAADDVARRARDVFELARRSSDAVRAREVVTALAARAEDASRAWADVLDASASLERGELDACENRVRAWSSTPREAVGVAPARANVSDAAATTGAAAVDARVDDELPAARASVEFALAEALFERREDARALPLYDRCTNAPGALGEAALYKAGFTRLRTGDASGAERDFARLVARSPRGTYAVEALYLRGEALARLDRLDEAADALSRAREQGPQHAVLEKVLFRLGVVEERRGRHAEARAALDAFAARAPASPNAAEADVWRGRALAGAGDPRAARAAFERAVARGEGAHADAARIELGRAAAANGDHAGALEAFLKVALLSGSATAVPEALWLAGGELEALGQPERARDRYREIVNEHGDSAFAARAREKLSASPGARPGREPGSPTRDPDDSPAGRRATPPADPRVPSSPAQPRGNP